MKNKATIEQLFLSELRVLKSNFTKKKTLSIEPEYKMAFVDLENLNALGYSLTERGILQLAKEYGINKNMTPLYVRLKDLIPNIEVDPMYPNFPLQVLEMGDLEYRFNQFLHYMSTYGVEEITGEEVQQGWTPKTKHIPERGDDVQLRELIVLDYLEEGELVELIIDKLIGKKERLLSNELKLAKYAVSIQNRKEVKEIPFKENIGKIYGELILNADLETRYILLNDLSSIFKHPGDILDFIEELIVLNKYKHFKTSLKRGFVKLIESYSTSKIEENLASNRWSSNFLGKKKKRRSINRNIAVIDYLSYSKFSQNKEAMKIVNDLKDGKLLSWNQRLERAYEINNMKEVRNLLSQRPGVYFRQLNRVYKKGVSLDLLSSDVKEFAKDLKTQSIVSTINNFNGEPELLKVFYEALLHNLSDKKIDSIANKKVFVQENEVSLIDSKIEVTDKFQDGGYIQNGIAIKIPEDAKFIRFFTHWNDKTRIDIDLHCSYEKNGGINVVGWNSIHKRNGVVYSGDMTHSNSTEYIDFDLEETKKNNVTKAQFNINSYTRVKFSDIDTVFAGIMVLSEENQKVKLYDDKNVLFRHNLENENMAVDYAFLDFEKNVIYIVGKASGYYNNGNLLDSYKINLSIKTYLSLLALSQKAEIVENEEDADVVIGLAKSPDEDYVSLIDENYFMD